MGFLPRLYQKISKTFIGDDHIFSLEHRLFNLFSFFICCVAFTSFFLNIAFKLYESALVTIAICLVQSIILYISRVEKRFKLSLILTAVTLNLMLSVNYFINGGITGPTLIVFLSVLFLMTSILSQKTAWLWIISNFLLVAILFTIEYNFADLILVGYADQIVLFSDVYTTYILVVILITTSTFYKNRAYEKQKKILESKAIVLEKLNSEQNKLFSIISHDLRAPIGAVKQYLDFLKEPDLTNEEKAIVEEGLVRSTNEAYELLDNLLIWTKSQFAGQSPNIVKLNPSVCLADTLSQAETNARLKDIVIERKLADIEVSVDHNMLQLVIRNLLFNAIKFSHPNSKILFEVYTDHGNAIFKITDTGIGISEPDQKKIFTLSVRSNVGTAKEKGSGLGLVLCKEYTHLQNGTIWFESSLNRGSAFYVSLPLFS